MPWKNADNLTPAELARMPYIAYGSNMSIDGMKGRCPGAKAICSGRIEAELVFRGVADIVPQRGGSLPVGLWFVDENNVRALDVYEGWPRLYQRVIIPVKAKGKTIKGFAYIMTTNDESPPSPWYYHIIRTGYADFKCPAGQLHEALEASLPEKDRNRHLIRFHEAVSRMPRKIKRPTKVFYM